MFQVPIYGRYLLNGINIITVIGNEKSLFRLNIRFHQN